MRFVTSGDITRMLASRGYDVDLGDVSYALRRLKVKPIGVAGITRLFRPESADKVRAFLDRKSAKEVHTCSA